MLTKVVDNRLCNLIINEETSNIAIIYNYEPTEATDNNYKDFVRNKKEYTICY